MDFKILLPCSTLACVQLQQHWEFDLRTAHNINMALTCFGAMEKLLGQRFTKGPSTVVKITALTSWALIFLSSQGAVLPSQYENSQERWDVMLHISLFIHPSVVSLDPYGLCGSQLLLHVWVSCSPPEGDIRAFTQFWDCWIPDQSQGLSAGYLEILDIAAKCMQIQISTYANIYRFRQLYS